MGLARQSSCFDHCLLDKNIQPFFCNNFETKNGSGTFCLDSMWIAWSPNQWVRLLTSSNSCWLAKGTTRLNFNSHTVWTIHVTWELSRHVCQNQVIWRAIGGSAADCIENKSIRVGNRIKTTYYNAMLINSYWNSFKITTYRSITGYFCEMFITYSRMLVT